MLPKWPEPLENKNKWITWDPDAKYDRSPTQRKLQRDQATEEGWTQPYIWKLGQKTRKWHGQSPCSCLQETEMHCDKNVSVNRPGLYLLAKPLRSQGLSLHSSSLPQSKAAAKWPIKDGWKWAHSSWISGNKACFPGVPVIPQKRNSFGNGFKRSYLHWSTSCVYVCRSGGYHSVPREIKEQLTGLILSFHHVSPKDGTQVVSLGSNIWPSEPPLQP